MAFLDEKGLQYVIQKIKEEIDLVVCPYSSPLQFPSVGNENSLYTTETNEVYRWSDKDLKYYQVGQDYNNITLIDGRG